MHLHGLTQLIRSQGGMCSMRKMSSTSLFVEKVLYWYIVLVFPLEKKNMI